MPRIIVAAAAVRQTEANIAQVKHEGASFAIQLLSETTNLFGLRSQNSESRQLPKCRDIILDVPTFFVHNSSIVGEFT